MKEPEARGLKCPIPVIKLSSAVRGLPNGAELRIVAEVRGFAPDVRAWCEQTGRALVSRDEHDPQGVVAVVRAS